MKPDYLWDATGEPDPELQRMEKSLAQFRFRGEPPVFPALETIQQPSRFAFLTRGWTPRLACASLLLLAVVASALLLRVAPSVTGLPATEANAPGWNVARLSGAPSIGPYSLGGGSTTKLKVGQLLITDGASSASLNSADFGEVYIDPGSRVRLVDSASHRQRIFLDLGTIHAAIWAPPGEFQVDTPSASAVDLGCAYTLHVNPDGSGTLRTTLGWVGFHKDGRDSFIPAGAMCSTHPTRGPGTPYFEDAPPVFREALHSLDFDSGSTEAREKSLRTVLAQARPRDAFTLWHLLSRVDENQRPLVYDRLAALVPLPAGVTREGTLALNPTMLDAWWNAFDLGDISVWRYWEQNQAPANFKKTAVNKLAAR